MSKSRVILAVDCSSLKYLKEPPKKRSFYVLWFKKRILSSINITFCSLLPVQGIFFSLLSSGFPDLKNTIIWKPFTLKLVEHFRLMYA